MKEEQIANVLLHKPAENQSATVRKDGGASIAQGFPGWRGQPGLFTALRGQPKQCAGFAARSLVHNYQPLAIGKPGKEPAIKLGNWVVLVDLSDLVLTAADGRNYKYASSVIRQGTEKRNEAPVG